ncbi:MAG TPA: PAS domain S-box protein [Gemmatimonadaceae bacterium]|nr:PAS domain S-box protein [Gemmatimonadaceae bacterium]
MMRDAMVVADAATGTVVLWNAAAERLFGFAAAEMVGRSLDAIVPERLQGAHHGGLARFTATGHGPLVDSGLPVQVPARRRDGTEVEVELSLTPITEAGEEGSLVCATIRDVSERIRLGEELRAARLEVAERRAESAQARLEGALLVSRTVAHEINNALAPLLGYAELLSLRPEVAANPQSATFARLLMEGADGIAEQVRRLQSIIRLEEAPSVLGTGVTTRDLKRSGTPDEPTP